MKKTGVKIYAEHPKSKRVFGDAIDWVDRPKRKGGKKNRKKITRIANRRERRKTQWCNCVNILDD